MRNMLGKFGPTGAVVAAAACPVCFPKLAVLGAVFGLGAMASYEALFLSLAQVLVAVSLIGHIAAYRKHNNPWPMGLVFLSTASFFVSLYVRVSETLSYVSLVGLILASVWLIFDDRRRVACAAG